MRSFIARALVFAVFSLSGVGCSSEPRALGASCLEDCETGLSCYGFDTVNHICSSRCDVDADCERFSPAGLGDAVCENFLCRLDCSSHACPEFSYCGADDLCLPEP